MRAYRLTRSKYPAFSGTGSLFANGRWHWAGVPVVYCAESRALAVLEALVHTRKDQIPSDYVFFELVIDDSLIRVLSSREIPVDWREIEPVHARTVGAEWMKSWSSVGLIVPSVVIPDERNLLINPELPDFQSPGSHHRTTAISMGSKTLPLRSRERQPTPDLSRAQTKRVLAFVTSVDALSFHSRSLAASQSHRSLGHSLRTGTKRLDLMIEQNCRLALRFRNALRTADYKILNDIVL